jgi:hypothetical protein
MTDSWQPPKTIDPTNVKVILTTRWQGTSYKSVAVRRVESYSISSHMDSDADPWSVEIGDPEHKLNAMLARDNEVRVQIFGVGQKGNVPLLVGIMDDVELTESATLTLTGRDMSAIAIDSDHLPIIYRGINPIKIIEMEAKEIGVTNKFNMRPIKGGPKRAETDGSEKYWEFWYRLVRKDGRFLWLTAPGTLMSDDLTYNVAPKYSFASQSVAKKSDIPVENFTWHKSTQTRVYEFAVEWRSQDISTGKPTVTLGYDKQIKDWVKKPIRIIQDKHAVTNKSAAKIAFQEIYESRVGALEIVLTVADPGYLIQANNVAHVNIPEHGLVGNWFVVGSTIRGGPQGFLQDVRLRERHFAISHRVPDDPAWTKDPSATAPSADQPPQGKAAKAIFGQMGKHGEEWWQCYVDAAQKHRGKYDLALFIAVLLAISDHETGFTNERSIDMAFCVGGGGQTNAPGAQNIEWYDIRKQSPTPAELDEWKQNFANQGGDGYLPSGYCCAVGPMQIFNTSTKEEADRMSGPVNEFFGGRWVPCNSIMAAAGLLASNSPTQDGSEADLYAGVCRYGGYSPGCSYGEDIKNRVHNDPGWLQLVQDALNSVPPEGAPGSSPPAPKDSGAAQFAKRLQLYHSQGKFRDDNGRIMAQVNKVADGQPWNNQCGETIWCDSRTLGVCCWLIESGYYVGLYALCEDHSCLVQGQSNRSAHSLGKACDIDSIGIPGVGWYYINNPDDTAHRIIIQVMELLKKGGWLLPSQVICNGNGSFQRDIQIHQWNDGPTDYITGDHTNHIHVGYR